LSTGQRTFRARDDVLDVQSSRRHHRRVDQVEVLKTSRTLRSEYESVEGRVELCRDDGNFKVRYDVRPLLCRAGNTETSPAHCCRARVGFAQAKPSSNLFSRQLSDHAGKATFFTNCRCIRVRCKKTFQAEDEIAAITSAIGASFGGALAVTTTRPRRSALKRRRSFGSDVELPLLIINIQRGGPSTGLPTKTEQADLLQALYGRNVKPPFQFSRVNTERLLSYDLRSCAYCSEVHDPCDHVVRWIP